MLCVAIPVGRKSWTLRTARARLISFTAAIAKVDFLTPADESAFAICLCKCYGVKGATADKIVVFRRP